MEGNIQSGDLGWRAALTPDLQKHDLLTPIKEVKDLGKAYVDLHGRLANAVFVPGDNATPEERKAYAEKMGIPADPAQYDLDRTSVPAEIYSEDTEKWFRDTALRLGLSKSQASGLFKEYNTLLVNAYKEQQTALTKPRDESIAKLKGEWGTSFDANLQLAKRVVSKFGGEDFIKYLNESGFGDHPLLIKTLHAVGKVLSEDAFKEGESLGGVGGAPGRRQLSYPSMQGK